MSHFARSVGVSRGRHAAALRAGAESRSVLEETFARDMRALFFPAWEREYTFLEGRKYRLDFAWPGVKLGIEVDGAVHRIKSRFHSDREKHALSLLAGWRILPVTGLHVRDGRAITWAAELLFRALYPGRTYDPQRPFSRPGGWGISDGLLFDRRNAPT